MDSILPDIQPRALNGPLTADELLKTLRDCNYLRVSSQEASQYIQDAHHDLNLFENHIQHIRARQATLKRDITRYGSLHAPARKIPPEVLRRMFGFASGQSMFARGYANKVGWSSMIFRISSVCSRWRDVAVHSPELWADMCFDLDERAKDPVQLSLARAHTHPLSLEVKGGSNETQARTELLLLLKKNSSRLSHLDLQGFCPDLLENFGSTPILESIQCDGLVVDDILAECIPHAPRLHQIVYCMSDWVSFESMSFLPRTVRHFEMEHDGSSTLFSLFDAMRNTPMLEFLVYTGAAIYDSGEPFQTSDEDLECVVSNMTSLTIQQWGAEGFFALVSHLLRGSTLPHLKHLTIDFTGADEFRTNTDKVFEGQWPRPELHVFLKRSGCNLTTLSLKGLPLPENDVLALLEYTPSLHSLTLHEFLFGEDLARFEHLSRKLHKTVTKMFLRHLEATTFSVDAFSVQHSILPKLKYLELKVQSHFDADETFVDVVQSRWNRATGDLCSINMERLRTVVLYVAGRELAETIYEPLRRVDEAGMMVSVFGDGKRIV
ncbi:hypothetical protein PM082_015298 [Marasmius tenuissimus]|nr:hypothetical protein PM082_015298 [Marasmius tenuissimus]